MSHDSIYNPKHYTVYPVQPIEITRYLGFCLGNATKYVLRAPYKGGPEDCDKALRYLELEKENPQTPLFHHEYELAQGNLRILISFLLHAEGDMLFGDIAISQLDYLGQLDFYLFNIDMRSPAKAWRENIEKMQNSLRDLRRVLEIRDRPGDIYEGMTGLPEKGSCDVR